MINNLRNGISKKNSFLKTEERPVGLYRKRESIIPSNLIANAISLNKTTERAKRYTITVFGTEQRGLKAFRNLSKSKKQSDSNLAKNVSSRMTKSDRGET